jgi:hypothetical protein
MFLRVRHNRRGKKMSTRKFLFRRQFFFSLEKKRKKKITKNATSRDMYSGVVATQSNTAEVFFSLLLCRTACITRLLLSTSSSVKRKISASTNDCSRSFPSR